MSVEIHQFLDNSGGNNFTESTPRPPVGPGEENELRSTGGQSNKSSASQKSQGSNRSVGSAGTGGATPRRSQKSSKLPPTTSTAAASTGAGGASTVIHVATGSSDTTNSDGKPELKKVAGEEETDAPLGFEPEGSVDDKARFTETGSPPCARWNEGLEQLLEDPDGVGLFKSYLTQENSVNLFEFYFAWKCLQNLDTESESSEINNLARAMYKAFCKGEKKLPCLTAETKERISKHISSKTDVKNAFTSLKDQVLEILNRVFYVPFFKSSVYVQYVDNMEASPKEESSTHSSGCASNQPVSMILPTVHEDSELDLHQMSSLTAETGEGESGAVQLSLTVKNMKITERLRLESKIKPEEQAGYYLQKVGTVNSGCGVTADDSTAGASIPPHPYYTSSVSYLPISAIDSERQSLSSEALTDDTHSVTDSSVDGGFPQFTNKKSIQKYYKRIKSSAQRNPESHTTTQHHILPPKSHRLAKVSNLAELKPVEFAKILSEKLQRVLDEQVHRELVRSKLNAMSEDDGTTDDSHSVLSGNTAGASTTNTDLKQLLDTMQAGRRDDDSDAQAILDMHCKRIWERSGHHTPSKSPSRAKSPDMFPATAIATTAPLYNPPSKRMHAHTIPRQILPSTSSSTRQPFAVPPPYVTKPNLVPMASSTVSYPSDNSAFQLPASASTAFPTSYVRSNSRQGMATFSSRAEQQSIFKLPPTQSNNNQKVVEWISRNEEIMQHSNIADSDKSSVRRSQRSASTSASPRILRNKGHSKGASVDPKRPAQDDKHSFKSKSNSSGGKQRSAFSRSSGGESSASQQQTQQTLTQRKGVREPPQIKVAFFLLDEPIPYSTTVPGVEITLSKFKELITKKGNYRYFFKKATGDEFGQEVPYVLEEISNDNTVLPKWESKVVGHVKKVE